MAELKNAAETAKSVLVTGAAGLLGSYVAQAFRDAGYRVVATDIAARDGADVIAADLMQLDRAVALIRDVDHVVHIASLPRPVGYRTQDVHATNTTLMFNVVEAMERNGINSLLYASSFSVLGLPFGARPVVPDYFPLDSAHATRALDIYALTKLMGETAVDYWVARTGGRGVSLRMPWIQYEGTFSRDVLPRRDTSDARLDLWAYIDARDAARAFVLAAQAGLSGHHRYFISAADTYSERETAALLDEYYPGVPLKEPLDGFSSLISNREAEALTGFRPHHGWREYALCDTVQGKVS